MSNRDDLLVVEMYYIKCQPIAVFRTPRFAHPEKLDKMF